MAKCWNKLLCHFLKEQRPSLEDEFSYLDDMVIYHLTSGLCPICTQTAVDKSYPITASLLSFCSSSVYFLGMYTGYGGAAVALYEVYSVGTRLESQLSQRVFPCFSPFVMPVRINTTPKYSTNAFSETLAITIKTILLSR
jgi:hypothetical protein